MTVGDDGRGGADPDHGSGLRGIRRRLASFNGTLAITSPAGGPTTAIMEIPVRVVIAEDQYLLRAGLSGCSPPTTSRPSPPSSPVPTCCAAIGEHAPDLAIVDVRLPPTYTDEGLRAALAARRDGPGLPILVLSQYVEQLYARELLADGRGGSATCSRTGCSTTASSSTRSAGSPPAAPRWTRRSSPAAGHGTPATQPADRAHPARTRGARTHGRRPLQRRHRRSCSCPSARSANTPRASSTSSAWSPPTTTTAASSRSSPTSASRPITDSSRQDGSRTNRGWLSTT